MRTFAVFLFCLHSSAFALISPSWTAYSNFKAALDGDSCFTVQNPAVIGNIQKIVIQACSDEKAQAWQTIVSNLYHRDSGFVEFQGPSGQVKPMEITGETSRDRVAALAKVFTTAFSSNPNLNSVMPFDRVQCPMCQVDVALEMKPRVIQVFMDDLSDPWGQHNKTAQDHFADLLNLRYSDLRVVTTTAKKP